jgi:TRAP-type C4-dicarboxylate transport system permease small subunit
MSRSRIGRAYDRLYALLGVVAAALFAAMALSISVDVIVRNSGVGTIPWINEAAEYMQYVAAFLGAPWVLRLGAHVRVDILLRAAPRRLAVALEVLANLAGMAISGTLLYYAVTVARNAYDDGALVIKSFVMPEWWIFALLSVSALLLLVEFIRRLVTAREAGRPAPTSL